MTLIARTALAAPLLLLGYGVLRLVDGRDGAHGPGLAWDAGHVLFLLAFLCFGGLLVGLRRLVPGPTGVALLGAGLAGTAAFLWVIVGDLVPAVDRLGTPDVVMLAGPLLFQVGTVGLLTLAAVRRRVPWWTPVVVLAGFVPIAVSLDLLPLAALVLLAGLSPLLRRRNSREPVVSGARRSWT